MMTETTTKPMTDEERAELIESILDDLAALGLIRQTTKKAGA